MNLASYLQMAVIPLADRAPVCEKRQREKAKKSTLMGPNKNCANANKAKHDQAAERYKAAMRGTWATTKQLEDRLGMSRACCTPNLRKWESMGLVECRKIGPSDSWTRQKGIEWRWL